MAVNYNWAGHIEYMVQRLQQADPNNLLETLSQELVRVPSLQYVPKHEGTFWIQMDEAAEMEAAPNGKQWTIREKLLIPPKACANVPCTVKRMMAMGKFEARIVQLPACLPNLCAVHVRNLDPLELGDISPSLLVAIEPGSAPFPAAANLLDLLLRQPAGVNANGEYNFFHPESWAQAFPQLVRNDDELDLKQLVVILLLAVQQAHRQ
ncbi:hypothetical protein BASA81_000969 [Batrachochytrium salamandrivorans]|nr:hypothetical protein BASA81_000969 [Batrachochytrium salamandrivorans]